MSLAEFELSGWCCQECTGNNKRASICVSELVCKLLFLRNSEIHWECIKNDQAIVRHVGIWIFWLLNLGTKESHNLACGMTLSRVAVVPSDGASSCLKEQPRGIRWRLWWQFNFGDKPRNEQKKKSRQFSSVELFENNSQLWCRVLVRHFFSGFHCRKHAGRWSRNQIWADSFHALHA